MALGPDDPAGFEPPKTPLLQPAGPTGIPALTSSPVNFTDEEWRSMENEIEEVVFAELNQTVADTQNSSDEPASQSEVPIIDTGMVETKTQVTQLLPDELIEGIQRFSDEDAILPTPVRALFGQFVQDQLGLTSAYGPLLSLGGRCCICGQKH